MKFDDFLKKHGYPSIYPLQKKTVNNPLIVRDQFDVRDGRGAQPDGRFTCIRRRRTGGAVGGRALRGGEQARGDAVGAGTHP